jgi:hypothetical protein
MERQSGSRVRRPAILLRSVKVRVCSKRKLFRSGPLEGNKPLLRNRAKRSRTGLYRSKCRHDCRYVEFGHFRRAASWGQSFRLPLPIQAALRYRGAVHLRCFSNPLYPRQVALCSRLTTETNPATALSLPLPDYSRCKGRSAEIPHHFSRRDRNFRPAKRVCRNDQVSDSLHAR